MELRKDLQEIDINSMSVEVWRVMSKEERRAWILYWRRKGQVSFSCTECQFPTAYGTVGCEACRPIK